MLNPLTLVKQLDQSLAILDISLGTLASVKALAIRICLQLVRCLLTLAAGFTEFLVLLPVTRFEGFVDGFDTLFVLLAVLDVDTNACLSFC